jgi:hypothetical protein
MFLYQPLVQSAKFIHNGKGDNNGQIFSLVTYLFYLFIYYLCRQRARKGQVQQNQ